MTTVATVARPGSGGVSAHSGLTGLLTGDDHTQYALANGRRGSVWQGIAALDSPAAWSETYDSDVWTVPDAPMPFLPADSLLLAANTDLLDPDTGSGIFAHDSTGPGANTWTRIHTFTLADAGKMFTYNFPTPGVVLFDSPDGTSLSPRFVGPFIASTATYSPDDITDWPDPDPANVQAALDALAARVTTLEP